MKKPIRYLSFLALASASIFLNSCAPKGPDSAFSFDPSAKKPSNLSAVKIHISTSAGRLYVTEGNEVLLATPIGVGTKATPTPKGNFRILSKTRHRRRQGNPGTSCRWT